MEHFLIPFLLTVIAGLSSGIGGLIFLLFKDFKRSYLAFFLGLSAGVMIYIAFVEMLGSAIEAEGFLIANTIFFLGMFVFMLIDFMVPHHYICEHVHGSKNKRLYTAGIFTAIGITIHNFPEGIAVFMSSLSDITLGIPLAIAIALHNLPEGISISMPIYYASKSKMKAFLYSLFSGIAEPIGAIIAYLVLFSFLTDTILNLVLAFVGGIMVAVSFDELLPLCYENKHGHLSMVGIVFGMMVMAFSIHLIG